MKQQMTLFSPETDSEAMSTLVAQIRNDIHQAKLQGGNGFTHRPRYSQVEIVPYEHGKYPTEWAQYSVNKFGAVTRDGRLFVTDNCYHELKTHFSGLNMTQKDLRALIDGQVLLIKGEGTLNAES